MIADIIREGKVIKNVTFDFDLYYDDTNVVGYSDKLKSDVVVAAFSRRGVCMTLSIPREIKGDMRYAYFEDESEKIQFINRVRSFVK